MKVASRFLLPVEMLIGMYTLMWALSGSGLLGDGTLYYALLAADHNADWGLLLGGLGAAMVLVALLEWRFGKPKLCMPPLLDAGRLANVLWTVRCYLFGWTYALRAKFSTDKAIHRFVSIRATIAFFMCGAWIGAALVIAITPSLEHIALLYPAALLHVGFSGWVYIENLKVRYALDENYATSTLQFHR